MTRTGTLAAPILAAALILFTASAGAQTLCSAPIAPVCADVEATYTDSSATDRCRQAVETYAEAVDTYAACLGTQIEELQDHSEILQNTFACRNDGGTDCDTVPTIPGS